METEYSFFTPLYFAWVAMKNVDPYLESAIVNDASIYSYA
jgi:hypothetical protein